MQFVPALLTISEQATLVKSIKTGLTEAFGDQMPALRGNIQLVTEMLMMIESLKVPIRTDDEKSKLFFETYKGCFGEISEIEGKLLSGIVQHLRENGMVYRRTRVGNFIRAVLRLFRA